MLNLLNATNIDITMFWMLVILGVLLLIEMAAFAILLVRRARNSEPVKDDEPAPIRQLVGLSLDTAIVQRDFTVGTEFDCGGLLVSANYNLDPVSENITEYIVLSQQEVDDALVNGEISGCYVIKPDMSVAGKKAVSVVYQGKVALYAISIAEAVAEPAPEPVVVAEPQPVVVEPAPESVVVVEPAPEPVVEEIDRDLVGISIDVRVVQREFTVGDEFNCEGILINADFNIDPLHESIVEYSVVDPELFNRIASANEIAGCYVIKPDLTVAGKQTVTVRYEKFTAYYTIAVEEPVVEVVEEPVVAAVAEPVVEQPVETVVVEPQVLIYEEDSADNRLRYDRSFTARLIQSDDETKQWYTELKNELLSYKKSKARISWKRETFKVGKEVVAKLSYRGKTMCLYLPLDPKDFVDSKYHVEDVSDIPSNVDTPLLYRLKNDRRVKYAAELIAMVMEKFEAPRIERIAEDYYVAYEGTLDLINKGLIKRQIKSAADEAIFTQGKPANETPADDNNEPQEIAPGIFVTKKND